MSKSRPKSAGRSVRPPIKIFRPKSWYQHTSTSDYVAHLLMECGRLGLNFEDARRDSTRSAFNDLMDWLGKRGGLGLTNLYDWLRLDLKMMSARIKREGNARPRIEVTAKLTKKGNLSVVWHPGGWQSSGPNFRGERDGLNQIPLRIWNRPPDFRYFTGDESPYFDSRASNELMYIRGVGDLDPRPRHEYGFYAEFNHDVVDSVLICAIRAAYEGMIDELLANFDVTPVTTFDFEIESNQLDEDRFPVRRVTGWSLEDTVTLKKRRAATEAEARKVKATDELQSAEQTMRVSAEEVGAALVSATAQFKGDKPPSDPTLDKHAAKILQAQGFALNDRDVRVMRRSLAVARVDLLPRHLQPTPKQETAPVNVVPFPR